MLSTNNEFATILNVWPPTETSSVTRLAIPTAPDLAPPGNGSVTDGNTGSVTDGNTGSVTDGNTSKETNAESASSDIHARTDPNREAALFMRSSPAGPLPVSHGPATNRTSTNPTRTVRRWLSINADGTSDHASTTAVWSRSQPRPTSTAKRPTAAHTSRSTEPESDQERTIPAAAATSSHISDSRKTTEE